MQNYIANKQIIVYSKGVQERYKKGRKGIGMQIIIMNHGRFGEEMIASAEMLFGKIENGVVQENMVLEEIWDNINKIVDETEIKMLYQMFREKKRLSEILQSIDK